MKRLLKFKEFSEVYESFIFESESLDPITNKTLKYLRDIFQSMKYEGDRKSKHGAHLRFAIDQNNSKAQSDIEKVLKKAKISSYDISLPKIGDYGSGAKSGEYQTYIITIKEDTRIPGLIIKSGTSISIVNSVPQKGVFSGKILSPTGLKLILDKSLSLEELYSDVKEKVNKKFSNLPASVNVLESLVDEVYNYTPSTIFPSPLEIKPFESSIPYSESTEEYLKNLSPVDLNAIGKDFGEVLGGLFLLKCVDAQKGVKYPKGNEPLVDFFLDDNIKISSKYQKGAAPTLSGIVKNVNIDILDNDNQRSLYEVLKISMENNVSSGYLEIAKHLKLPGFQIIAKIMSNEDPSVNQIETFVRNIAINKDGSFNNDKFFEAFDEFYQTIGSWPKGKKIDWEKLKANDKFYGVVIGPLSQYIPKILNADSTFVNALKSLCSMVPVNQLYLNFELKSSSMDFHLKSFIDESSEFQFEAPNQSVYNPDNGRLGFSMK